ncbi:MAG: isoleucine--tRNA ligase [Euryarchaeota archaeon]|nr:isoleucine--tRNA ligase [Euryarchaeota archaeon]
MRGIPIVKAPERGYDHQELEPRLLGFWQRTKAYDRLKEMRASGKDFYFLDGPPFAIGHAHVGLAFNKIIKDAVLRHRRMSGYNVRDQPGFDSHGLPIEIEVEAKLGIKVKRKIEEIGIEKFIDRCVQHAKENAQAMTYQFEDLGVWMDWQNASRTSTPEFMEGVWWTFKKAHANNLIVHENRVVPWCTRCETALTDFEVVRGMRRAMTVYLKFPIRGKRDEYLLVWTAEPWTLIANAALAVNPGLSYAKVRIRKEGKRELLILLEKEVENVSNRTGIEAYEIVETVKGDQLVGMQYFHPLMADVPFQKSQTGDWVHKVIPSGKVRDERTGIIHVAPGLCPEDTAIAKERELKSFSPVDERGVLTSEAGTKYGGLSLDEATRKVIADFKAMKFLLHEEVADYRHGHCWRCSSPLINRMSNEWFLKTDQIRDSMLRALTTVQWLPDEAGSSRFYNWVGEADDWCISKKRYWGVPIPVWECLTDVCGHVEVLGSLKDLRGCKQYEEGMDLHRPWIDKLTLDCPKCGGMMRRVPDILDVWFDSSTISWSQLGYPGKKTEFKRWWPCDLVAEGKWQSKGWLYAQLCTSSAVFNRVPYKSALLHGRVTYVESVKEGGGMPHEHTDLLAEAVARHGRDAFRIHLLRVPPWNDRDFSIERMAESAKLIRKLWNTYVFAARHMAVDGFSPKRAEKSKALDKCGAMERWLLSRLDRLCDDVNKAMDRNETHRAIGAISRFIVEDLSRWYLRTIKDKVWAEDKPELKEPVYAAIGEALLTVVKLFAPFAPFVSEEIYQSLDGRLLSVHMCDYPKPVEGRRNEELEAQMEAVRSIVHCAYKARQRDGRGLRWPVKKMIIEAKAEAVVSAAKAFQPLILEQANAKEIDLVPLGEEWKGLDLKAELKGIEKPIDDSDESKKTAYATYRQLAPYIKKIIQARPARELRDKIKKGGYKVGIEGTEVEIRSEWVVFVSKLPDNVFGESFPQGSVYVDMTLDDQLVAEGFSREITRQVQQMRKEMGTCVEDFVRVSLTVSGDLQGILEPWNDRMMAGARCRELEYKESVDEDYVVELNIRDETIVIGVTQLGMKAALDDFMRVPGMTKDAAMALFDAGYAGVDAVASAQREDVAKVPGVSNALVRRIKEFYDKPPTAQPEEAICPTCGGEIDQGAVECPRCGAALIPQEGFEGEEEEVPEVLAEKLEGEVIVTPTQPAQVARALLETIQDLKTQTEKKKAAPEKGKDATAEDIAADVRASIAAEDTGILSSKSLSEQARKDGQEGRPVRIITTAAEDPAPKREQTRAVQPAPMPEPPRKTAPAPKPEPEVEKKPRAEEKARAEPEVVAPAPEKPEKEAPISTGKEDGEPVIAKAAESDSDEDEKRDVLLERRTPEDKEQMEKGTLRTPDDKDAFISKLSDLTGIHPSISRAIYEAGFDTFDKLAKADEADLRKVERVGKVTARKIRAVFGPKEKEEDAGERKKCVTCGGMVPAEARVCPRCGGAPDFSGAMEAQTDAIERGMQKVNAVDRKLAEQPENPDLLYSKAMILIDNGEKDEAEGVLKKALRVAPDHEKARRALERLTMPAPQKPVKAVETAAEAKPAETPRGETVARVETVARMESETRAVPEARPEQAPEARTVQTPGPAPTLPPVAAPAQATPEQKKMEDRIGVIDLRESSTYIVIEEQSELSYGLFKRYIDKGMRGLCVTRSFPAKVRERYGLKDVPILWLSNVGKEDSVRPKDMEKLSLSLEQFLSKQGGLVMLDGIEYLITNNNFITVLRLIQSVRDHIAINRSILLISLNPRTLNSNELNLLTKEVDAVIE